MTTYEALMGEISAIQSARDSLPNNLHIGALFELVIDVANGTTTKSERTGVGEDEFAPWSIGPQL